LKTGKRDEREPNSEMEIEIAVAVETCLNNKYKVLTEYRNRFGDIHFNLGRNKKLLDQLLQKKITAEEICEMTSEQLASEELSILRQKNKEWNTEAARSDTGSNQAMTELYRCSRCKNNKCRFYQQQIRSADEPMTTFITCNTCGKKWKE